jgi:hypothetical protein
LSPEIRSLPPALPGVRRDWEARKLERPL